MNARWDFIKLAGLAAAFIVNSSLASAADLSLIPWPSKVEGKQGEFVLTDTAIIVTDASFTNEAALTLFSN